MRLRSRHKEKIIHDNELKVNIINSSTRTEGIIHCESSIRFDGNHTGDIVAEHKIVIGQKGIINGNLFADNIEIFGLVTGICNAKKSIMLSASSNFSGSIVTMQIVIAEGAVFNGNIDVKTDKIVEVLPLKNIGIKSINSSEQHLEDLAS